jgi:hypothetical protein
MTNPAHPPLPQVVDGPHEELRREALDTMCALAVALGQVRGRGGGWWVGV